MIIDSVSNMDQYQSLGSNFATAARFLRETDLSALPLGRIEIDGKKVYATVTDTDLTKTPAAWEVHRAYADIQLIISGDESIGYYPLSRLDAPLQFPADKDAVKVEGLPGTLFPLKAGEMMILLPQDMHLPNCPVGGASHARKMVMKVLLDD